MPEISVIMGIYNCASTLNEAINSIVQQTYSNWELVLCDDGSTDNTVEIAMTFVKQYPDKIILLKNGENRGLNYTLNRCLSVAQGKYIARMDGDDRCSLDRFQKEIDVLEKEKEIAIVSSDMKCFDEYGTWGLIRHPDYPCAKDFIKGSPFCHAPCMVRKEAYDVVGGYSEEKRFLRVEDYHLWVKMYQNGFRGKNIHEALYQMRDDKNAYHRRKFRYRINEFYVKCLLVKVLKLPIYYYIFAFRPIAVGLLPTPIYDCLHKRKLAMKI